MRKRWKRKSGYVTPSLVISKKALIHNNLFINRIYSDWNDWRDGFRDWFKDYKTIKKIPKCLSKLHGYEKRIVMNRKIIKKMIIRKKNLSKKH
ncbi:MAG: hypothetical protein ACMXYC_00155 [Candidatus Woesearchaeota archaeon]